jgi:hypothetical protein
VDRRSRTCGSTAKLRERDRRCPDAIGVLCVNHRRSFHDLLAKRWPPDPVSRFAIGIVTHIQADERSSAALQYGPVSAWYYSDAVCRSRQLARRTSAVSNRREWITGYTAAANTSTITAATPVRSDSSGTPQSILMP